MDLKKKIVISLISFWGVGIILAFVFAGILVLQRNLSIPKVQASPGPACQVPDDLDVTGSLTVGGKTNIVYPVNPWSTIDCTNFDAGNETCNFTPDTNYSAVMIGIAADVESDTLVIGFFDAVGGGGNEIGRLYMGSAVCESAIGSFYRPAHSTVLLPTSVKSAKILQIGGCTRGTTLTNNIVIMAYFK